jgi:hypothetical protein
VAISKEEYAARRERLGALHDQVRRAAEGLGGREPRAARGAGGGTRYREAGCAGRRGECRLPRTIEAGGLVDGRFGVRVEEVIEVTPTGGGFL